MTVPGAEPTSEAYDRARRGSMEPLKDVDPDASHWVCMREPCYQIRHDASQWEGDLPVCYLGARRRIGVAL